MNAMNFAWSILKMPRESSLDDDVRAMRQFVLQNHNNPDPQIQQDVENVYQYLTQVMSARQSGGPAPTLMKPPRIEGFGKEGSAMGTGTPTPSQPQPSSRVEKYDPSTYNQPGQALPAGRAPPKDPEMARRSRQQRTMEAGAERGRIQSQRDRVMDEMKETGITQDAMGALLFQELMRASKTPEGMARIKRMISERRGEGAAGRGADPQTDRIQMSEPMDAIDAAWAVLKSV
tara:strand:- start:1703 stop:2398 length:696 start_codon:yes stop_codon:yes gene_type:complete